MSKPFMISVALSALIVTAAPAMAQRHPGPSKLRDADHSPPTAVTVPITVPALIRSRAQPDQPPPPGNNNATKVSEGATLRAGEPQPDNAAGPHVKVFDGATLRAGEPQPDAASKPTLFVRKAGGKSEAVPQRDGEESAAARMQTQNNLKQMGLGAH
ncbi:MAG: hypothetical protein ABI810_14955 [Sphingomonas bacterium]